MSDTITWPSAAEQQRLEFQREVLRQLEDTTNQTWASKRKRWARLVRAQGEEIDRLRAALEQPEPPPEAQTEAEKIAYCAGWWAAMEQKREQPAQEPVALFDARLRAWRG